jgi:hypothetical protein
MFSCFASSAFELRNQAAPLQVDTNSLIAEISESLKYFTISVNPWVCGYAAILNIFEM